MKGNLQLHIKEAEKLNVEIIIIIIIIIIITIHDIIYEN